MVYDKLPEHMRGAARLWVEEGMPQPEHLDEFFAAVLANDLVGAFSYADPTNTAAMKEWAAWLYNDCPRPARGNTAALKAWHERGGLNRARRTIDK